MQDMNLKFDEFLALVIPTSAAFIVAVNTTTIVQSLQNNILNPVISLLPGLQGDFGNSAFVLRDEILDDKGNVLQTALRLEYGMFLTNLITFMIVLLIVYIMIIVLYKASKGKIDGTKKL